MHCRTFHLALPRFRHLGYKMRADPGDPRIVIILWHALQRTTRCSRRLALCSMPPRPVLALLLAWLTVCVHADPGGNRRLLRAPAPAPLPAPGPLDAPSGGGADCVAASLLLPLAGPAMTNAAAGMLEVCRSNDASCQETLVNATYLVAAAISLTLSTTVAEEAFNGEQGAFVAAMGRVRLCLKARRAAVAVELLLEKA